MRFLTIISRIKAINVCIFESYLKNKKDRKLVQNRDKPELNLESLKLLGGRRVNL